MILSICICSLDDRLPMLAILLRHLQAQIDKYPGQAEVVVETDNRKITTGEKRNILYARARGKYVCSIDDDDWVSNDYVSEIMEALKTEPDAIAMHGTMTTNSGNPLTWFISAYNPYAEVKKNGRTHYLRFTNHLSPVKKEIAIQFPFPHQNHEEDYIFAKAMHDSHLIKTEVIIHKNIYEYRYRTKKN